MKVMARHVRATSRTVHAMLSAEKARNDLEARAKTQRFSMSVFMAESRERVGFGLEVRGRGRGRGREVGFEFEPKIS